MTKAVLFDPGYAKHINILSIAIEYIYSEINGIKNFNQKKAKFKILYPKIIKMTENNIGFCIGSLLWAVYLKTLNPDTIIEGNPCFGSDYDEQDAVEEINYSVDFFNKLKNDSKYYLNLNYEINPKFIEILEIYREFLILNDGFTKTQKINDLVLPQSILVPEKENVEKIYAKIQEVIKTGHLLDLLPEMNLVYKD